MARITLEQIQQELNEQDWQLISTEYKNLDSEIVVKCPEGHTVHSTWARLRSKLECPTCKQNPYKENLQTGRAPKKGQNRILALDQSSHKTGYAIFDDDKLIKYGVVDIENPNETSRIHEVKAWLLGMMTIWSPTLIGIEAIQYEQNYGITTFQTLARLQGVLMDLCFEQGIPVKVVSSNTWRAHCKVKGKTRADRKKSMQLLVKQWYDVSVSDDEADAIGLGRFTANSLQGQASIIDWE